jgi:hypothetical protein
MNKNTKDLLTLIGSLVGLVVLFFVALFWEAVVNFFNIKKLFKRKKNNK